ncbi:MAG: hypothetical protein AAGA56_28020, partial [Myxococcota bacterium]
APDRPPYLLRPMSPRRRRPCPRLKIAGFSLALGLLVVGSRPALAKDLASATPEEKETARRLLDEGDALFGEGERAEALAKYIAAEGIIRAPTTSVEVGKAYAAQGRLVEARDAYLRVIRFPERSDEPQAFVDARLRARRQAAALEPRIPSVTIVVEPADLRPVEVRVDGKPVSAAVVGQPLRVDPGRHRIEVRSPGMVPSTGQVELDEGATQTLELRLVPEAGAPPPPSSPVRPLPPPPAAAEPFPVATTIGFAVGGAGLIFGGVTGALSLARTSDLSAACPDQACPPEQQDTIDDATLFANLSNVGFAVGGAGVLFGVIALFTIDMPAEAEIAGVRIRPWVGSAGAGLRGGF